MWTKNQQISFKIKINTVADKRQTKVTSETIGTCQLSAINL
jgi:hypothetical protein